nr:MAG TPA: hypothetical protein [Caudoviricetes sp.]
MSTIAELEDKVKVLLDEIETLKREKKNETFEYPFEPNEDYWLVEENSGIEKNRWNYTPYDKPRYDQGHIFKTKQEAERERDKRALLTRFKQFRDKCNREWKPGTYDCKYFISYDGSKKVLESGWNDVWDNFNTFGYFYDERDCLRAIDLFGDEIKRLWVDE